MVIEAVSADWVKPQQSSRSSERGGFAAFYYWFFRSFSFRCCCRIFLFQYSGCLVCMWSLQEHCLLSYRHIYCLNAKKRGCKTLMKWLNVLGIWLMAIPEFVAILYVVAYINSFLSSNSGNCGVGCLGDLVVFLRLHFLAVF